MRVFLRRLKTPGCSRLQNQFLMPEFCNPLTFNAIPARRKSALHFARSFIGFEILPFARNTIRVRCGVRSASESERTVVVGRLRVRQTFR